MAYGTTLASYNVEDFGTERVSRSPGRRSTSASPSCTRSSSFDDAPVALR